ncbi:MAG: hypothetical protein JNN10_12660 [Sphingopyxis sp.]|uniref:hypothetical protein n=1 Tax=Sphingopyxis sp. TaxID=1908224 RepID=UPI001A59A0FB|nr:hypothetical protein [Sphingopyxis sp.]MBL9067137.1 hypothetical protein [Sphingopyxis sp.]
MLFAACPAAAQTGSDVSVTASTAYDSNPFLAFGNDTETASFRLELAPSVYRSDGVSSLKVSGRVEHVEYMRRYDSAQNLSANVVASHRISERLDATANFSISSSVSTTDFVGPIGVGDEVGSDDLPLPIDNDITLLGDRQRRNQAAADATLRYTPSEFDEIRWSSSARANRYGAARLQDSDYASQRLAYSRRINDGFMIGGLVDASISNFRDTRVGDARTLSPQLSVSALLGARLQASGSFGVAFTRTNLAVGRDTSTTFAGNATLCHKGSLSNFCVNGSRQVLPSAIGGVRKQTSAGATYSLRLSERETVQLGGSYSVASAPLAGVGGDFESIRGYARYERLLNERTRLFASAGYSDTSDDLGARRSNIQGAVGIVFKFGNTR